MKTAGSGYGFQRLVLAGGLVLVFVIAVAVLTNTTSEASASDCPTTCTADLGDLDDVVADMADLDYDIYRGHFELYDEETSSIYIPFAQPYDDYLVGHFNIDGDRTNLRFGGQDAVVYRGCTPPPYVDQMFFQHYSSARITAQDNDFNPTEYHILEASLGDPIFMTESSGNINTEPSADAPFDAVTNIVVTPDLQTWSEIESSYAQHPVQQHALNLQGIPEDWFVFSKNDLDLPRDTLTLIRTIKWSDEGITNGCRDVFLNNSFPFYVFQKPESAPRDAIPPDLRSTTPPRSQIRAKRELQRPFNRMLKHIKHTMISEHGMQLVSDERFV
ncbi:MAG: hypothetical protein GY794_22200, partial [bacterium]|nr:hypothetical protein [bacterium]